MPVNRSCRKQLRGGPIQRALQCSDEGTLRFARVDKGIGYRTQRLVYVWMGRYQHNLCPTPASTDADEKFDRVDIPHRMGKYDEVEIAVLDAVEDGRSRCGYGALVSQSLQHRLAGLNRFATVVNQ